MIKSQIVLGDETLHFSYLFSTKDRVMLENYFKFKHKYDYVLSDAEYFELEKIALNTFGQYDVVFYPESTGKHLARLAKALGKEAVVIPKNSKETIKALVSQQQMMKAERVSLMNCIDHDMNGSFQINKVKGNQRKRFRNILFQKVDVSNYLDLNVLLLDDSVFSGETLIALKNALDIDCDVNVLYSKY